MNKEFSKKIRVVLVALSAGKAAEKKETDYFGITKNRFLQ